MRSWLKQNVLNLIAAILAAIQVWQNANRGPAASPASTPSNIPWGWIGVGLLLLASSLLNTFGYKLRAKTSTKSAHAVGSITWCEELADVDTKNMFSRVTAIRWKPRRVFDGKNNYIEFEVAFVNASVFELKAPQLQGVAEFDGHPLPHPPRIVEPFPLVRGARTWMKIHQPLDLEIAKDLQRRVNQDGMKANLDFSKVRITFDVEFPGHQSWKWTWTGRDVSVKEITTFD